MIKRNQNSAIFTVLFVDVPNKCVRILIPEEDGVLA